MSANRTYIKFICTPLFMLFMNGCANTQVNSDRDALVNATRGAVNMLIMDQPVYKNAIASEKNKVTNALLYTTLKKAGILSELEKEIGNNFVIEESFSLAQLNKLCWTTKFLQHYKKDLSPQSQVDYQKVYAWVDAKQSTWLKKLNEGYTKDELGEDDCRK
ncbi:hypothetical protein [Acinetobacter nosocomialis]|uniref:hypothetical protein n=2 Tax=Acinetobacter nosocomialis TaxID=106654 RepID=UPI000D0B5E1B|nr:hypothetical protein [Acinetobacter nosocomialis]SSR41157.1 Uncharacterised protein [Acinetobacter baumannii]MBR7689992.1 hypothetical protein [Acinetobacter nosocomialis]MBR7729998.1 hypothetical protein [Acinetobacter nosocomialis]MBS0035053.1 hypothetical protein [Acinetobacter nosocomialis]MDQ8848988.1 hypothetical protein [Acinetobacter nosocomialis]